LPKILPQKLLIKEELILSWSERKMNKPVVLLYQPLTHGRTSTPPLSLAYLTTYIQKNTDFDVEIIVIDNDEKKFSTEHLKRFLLKTNPVIIGVTVNILNQFNALRDAEIFKQYPYVIFGGPQASLEPECFLKEDNFYVVKGEGELTFSNIVKNVLKEKSLVDIGGVIYRNEKQEIIENPSDQLIKDLDVLPWPDLGVFDYKKYRTSINGERSTIILTSRGCPFKCIYCYHQLNAGFRQRTTDNIIEEMLFYKNRYGINAIKFFDDNFTLRRKFVEEFCQKLIIRKIGMIWWCLSAAKNVDLKLLELMKKAGCAGISFGIESGTQKSLDLMGKRTTVEQNRQAIMSCRKAGIQSKAYIMVGFPWETKEDILKTGQFLKETTPDLAQILIVTPMPNTQLEKMVLKAGCEIDRAAIEGARDFNVPTFETENFTKEEIKILHKDIIRMYETSPRIRAKKLLSYIKNFPFLLKRKFESLKRTDSTQNILSEIKYWEQILIKNDPEIYKARYEIIKCLFPEKYVDMNAHKVADIGSGPLGGIFSVNKWSKMVAVDPLWEDYVQRFEYLIPKNITRIIGVADDLPTDAFNIIWAINSLDHSGNLDNSMEHLLKCLAPEGVFLLHIHMRTKEQLNKAHKMIVTEKQLRGYCNWTWVKIHEKCPIEGKPYKTWVGVYVK
jgi:anaerobic magnesium-protoporphyrin IX monomethyl ester cyclase